MAAANTTLKTIAGFAPLALALLMQRSVLPGGTGERAEGVAEAAVCEEIGGLIGCHSNYPTGCSPSAKYDPYLNLLKNQIPPKGTPSVRTLGRKDFEDLDLKTPKELTKDNHADFKDQLAALGEGRMHTALGYLYYAQKGASESVNCELKEIEEVDFHIGIGFEPTLAEAVRKQRLRIAKMTDDQHRSLNRTSIVVEMTPLYRFEVRKDWSLEELRAVTGRQVKVVGQLIVDNEHFNAKDDCARGDGPRCWRLGVWELHPVTQFLVCRTDTPCAEDSADWVELGVKIDETTAPPR